MVPDLHPDRSVDELPAKPVARPSSHVRDSDNLHAVIDLTEHNEKGESA